MYMENKRVSLIEIAKVFATIGTISVGGWPSMMALMQDYCVVKRNWLTMDEFSHGIALGQFMGPFGVNATIFIGYRTRGFIGAIVALIAFLAPCVSAVIVLSAFYMKFHHVPSLQSALRGISPVVIALIISAAYQMGKNKLKSFEPVFLMILAVILSAFLKVQVVVILLTALLYGFIKVKLTTKFDDKGGINAD